MPITGLPNPDIHRMCKRCRQWHEHYQVEMTWPPKRGLMSWIHVTLAETMDQTREQKCYCAECQVKNTTDETKFRKQATQGLISLAIIVLAIALGRVIGLDELLKNMASGR